jgi:Domain of unknown function (DUF397)
MTIASGNSGGACPQVAALPGRDVEARNSRHPSGPALACTRAEIAAFAAGACSGEFAALGGARLSARLIPLVQLAVPESVAG